MCHWTQQWSLLAFLIDRHSSVTNFTNNYWFIYILHFFKTESWYVTFTQEFVHFYRLSNLLPYNCSYLSLTVICVSVVSSKYFHFICKCIYLIFSFLWLIWLGVCQFCLSCQPVLLLMIFLVSIVIYLCTEFYILPSTSFLICSFPSYLTEVISCLVMIFLSFC